MAYRITNDPLQNMRQNSRDILSETLDTSTVVLTWGAHGIQPLSQFADFFFQYIFIIFVN
jgi:hypothetical protein